MYYNEVIRALNKNKVDYAIAAGVKVVLYGYPIPTADGVFIEEPIKFSEIRKKIEKIKVGNLIFPPVGIAHLKKNKLQDRFRHKNFNIINNE